MDDEIPAPAALPTDGSDPPEPVSAPAPSEFPTCCVHTIGHHVAFNPMMVCPECKNIIKCFHDERAYKNYTKFCQSRRRTILTGQVGKYWTVAFRSYDTYNR